MAIYQNDMLSKCGMEFQSSLPSEEKEGKRALRGLRPIAGRGTGAIQLDREFTDLDQTLSHQ